MFIVHVYHQTESRFLGGVVFVNIISGKHISIFITDLTKDYTLKHIDETITITKR